jgi:hypothetical protein
MNIQEHRLKLVDLRRPSNVIYGRTSMKGSIDKKVARKLPTADWQANVLPICAFSSSGHSGVLTITGL